jgi:hypothetical protein
MSEAARLGWLVGPDKGLDMYSPARLLRPGTKTMRNRARTQSPVRIRTADCLPNEAGAATRTPLAVFARLSLSPRRASARTRAHASAGESCCPAWGKQQVGAGSGRAQEGESVIDECLEGKAYRKPTIDEPTKRIHEVYYVALTV